MNHKKLCSCVLCRNTITTNQLPIHYGSKQCKTGKLFSVYKQKQSRDLKCQFCDFVGKSVNSITQHELYCENNPDKKAKVPSYGMTGKKGTNHYKRARDLGLPIPKMDLEVKKKLQEGWRKTPKCYSSKIATDTFKNLIQILGSEDLGRVQFHDGVNNKEFWLVTKDGNYFMYDCCFRDLKIIVEFQGTKFHPKSLQENWIAPFKSMGSKEDVWNKDNAKKQLAEKNGFTVLYIWSDSIESDLSVVTSWVRQRLTKTTK
jgi:hypothetical protein